MTAMSDENVGSCKENVIVKKKAEDVKNVIEASGGDDSLTIVVKKQEAALKKLEEKHGEGNVVVI